MHAEGVLHRAPAVTPEHDLERRGDFAAGVDGALEPLFDLAILQVKLERVARRRLMRMVATALASVPNPIGITGHTDALGYAPDAKYGNWELSSDRANAARRELIASGIPGTRIVRVEGRADLDHFGASDPLDPSNRRISITLLRR